VTDPRGQVPLGLPRAVLTAAFAVCAVYASLVAVFAGDAPHRVWGTASAIAYGAGALVLLGWKNRRSVDVALAAIVCGAVLVPLFWMAWRGQAQPEVEVVARSAGSLIHHGTPYESPQVLAMTTDPNAYNPYLPLMSVFGIPQALWGQAAWTDPRVWFGAVFVVVFALSLRIGGARDWLRWALLISASPVIAFELTTGGTDVPMVAVMCLGFALLWRPGGTRGEGPPGPEWRVGGSAIPAGLALGVASSMKATAWPALAVAFAMLWVRDGRGAARGDSGGGSPRAGVAARGDSGGGSPRAGVAALRFTAVALAVMAVCVGPFAVTKPDSLYKNTILFPLGLASVKSAAVSPLPGHLISQTGHLGHDVVVALLVLAGAGVVVSLFVRPPADVPAALWRLVIGLSLMFVLAPSTRFGYFIYPGTLVAWLLVCQAGRGPGEPPATPRTSGQTTGAPVPTG
jgi:hypothetical protein